jgi:uncharacterized ferritin-like protein (DUF455 family)
METFHKLVKEYFKGYLKPPFDTSGRTIAGMTDEVCIYNSLVKYYEKKYKNFIKNKIFFKIYYK